MYSGSIVALITPMTASGEIDYPTWDALLDWHVAEGTDGVVVAGTTGESPTISVEEVVELTRRAAARLAGRIPLIAGSGTHDTARSIARTRRFAEAGADAVLAVTPYYNKPTQEGLFRARIPLIAGSGTHDTARSIARTRRFAEAGADAVLAVTPYYNKPTQEGLFRHFTALA